MADHEFVDALDRFAEELDKILSEIGVSGENYSRDDLRDLARTGFAEFNKIYDEYLMWVMYGDDKKAKTLAMIRAARNKKKRF